MSLVCMILVFAFGISVSRRREVFSSFLMTLVILTLTGAPAFAARKLGFTLGVDIYNNLPAEKQLTNSAYDARAVGDQFELLGYEVTPGENSTRSQFYTLWQGFLDKISDGDTVALFLSGHGVEIEGENFLLPRDVPYIQYGRQEQLKNQSINISQLLLDVRKHHPNVIILIIDACRDNPFVPPEYKSVVPDAGGLAKMEAATGEFIMYSAAAGQTALDRIPGEHEAEHSIYVRNLLPLMQQPNLTVQDLAQTLRRNVSEQAQSASHQQWPAYYDGLLEKFCLVGCAAASESASPPPVSVTRQLDPPTLEAGLNLRPEDRRVVQEALTALGFDTRGSDGVFGAYSRSAIAAWQRDRKEEPTSYLTPSQYGRLLAEAEPKLPALESAQQKPSAASPVQNPRETAGAKAEITDCDRLAANPDDPDAVAAGIALAKIDSARAVAACREAVERFPGVARYEFQYGRALLKADRAEEALGWIRQAAEKDYTAAWYGLGALYDAGTGTAKDEGSAISWYRKAANRDYAPAQTTLGDMSAQGRGATRDDGEAVRWYRKAANQDYAPAQARLGAMYAQGLGVANDNAEALRLLRNAADQEDAYGQGWLGYMYFTGRGVGKDLGEAERWLRKAAEQGYAWAADTLKQVVSEREISQMPFSETRAENDFFILEDKLVTSYSYGDISVELAFRPKFNMKLLLTQDWLRVDDERGNSYKILESREPLYFKKCAYDSNACLQKDFNEYKGGQDVSLSFVIETTDPKRYEHNQPRYFKFIFKFLVFRPDGSIVEPVAIRVPFRQR
jgi:TPR repeat protein